MKAALTALALVLVACRLASAAPDTQAFENVRWDMSFDEVQQALPGARVVYWHDGGCHGKYIFVDSYEWAPAGRPVTVTAAFASLGKGKGERLATIMLTPPVHRIFRRVQMESIRRTLVERYGPPTQPDYWTLPQMSITLSPMTIHFTRAR